MTSPRSHGDPCGIARALDVVGERWALLIIRELLFGPKRFTDLKVGLAGASPNVLSQRLRELEADGVVQRRRAGGALYELTDWSRELHPILLQLGRWGARSPERPAGALSVDALMVALEATFVPENAAELRASYELRLEEERFFVDVDHGAIAIARGSLADPTSSSILIPPHCGRWSSVIESSPGRPSRSKAMLARLERSSGCSYARRWGHYLASSRPHRRRCARR